MTGRMLEKIEPVILKERPDVVLVYGDTNTTLAGALAAAKLQVPVGHVEAGLRSFNPGMPEEINRVLTDHVSTFLFAPTTTAMENLRREGINSEKAFLVGDVMYTAALFYAAKAETQSRIIERLSLRPGQYLLATIHRAENTDDPPRLRAVFEGLSQMAREMPVVLPLHPRTREALKRAQISPALIETLSIIKPVGYLDMIRLEKHARLIVTDSGGVQKEAFFYQVPCVTLRDETEWVELIDLGWNTLVSPASGAAVAAGIRRGLEAGRGKEEMVYGDGSAPEKILASLIGRVSP
jgi:UDP-GlcNAc3NAcA epimerase